MTEENATLLPGRQSGAPPPSGNNRAAIGPRDLSPDEPTSATRPRLGFLGVGWIGRHRMQAIHESGLAEVVAIADSSPEMLDAAREAAPGAAIVTSPEMLISTRLDGIVIATPSALHAAQSIAALEAGLAVFCQKPLGRTTDEVTRVVEAAERADRLLGVDFSYRFTEAFRQAREVIASGGIGEIYAADLVFHNAYGPDKSWFFDPKLSGGGCVMDLGVHLVDLALWTLGGTDVEDVSARLYSGGRPLADATRVEDFATARLDLTNGGTVQLACSWNLPAGRDAVISASFFGTDGGVRVRNLAGSFYDFVAERYRGTNRETLTEPPDAWGGRAAVDWARRLASGSRFDPEVFDAVRVARILDRIYGR